MSQLTRRSLLRMLGASGAVVAGSGLASAHSEHSEARKQLAEVRRATRKYHDVRTAIADGYMTDNHCVSNPNGDGAMGYHYVNFGLVDDNVDHLEPEVLVYEQRGGKRHLVAVEYLSTEPFTLFGHESHPPHGEVPHSLHAWVWKGNPNGVLANFNPNVRCPSE